MHLEAFWCTQAEIYGAMGGCVTTHLINLLVHPIPANQCLDVAPNQEGGENQEDEEPGEQESQAHAAERGRGGTGDSFADPSGQKGLWGPAWPAAALQLPPVPGHAGLPGKSPWERGVPGSGAGAQELPAPKEERLLPNPPAQPVASKAFPLGRLPVPPLPFPLCFCRGVCEMATAPPLPAPGEMLTPGEIWRQLLLGTRSRLGPPAWRARMPPGPSLSRCRQG